MRIQIVMRTADRQMKRSYLSRTLEALARQGIPAAQIHVFPTAPDLRWIDEASQERSTIHPAARVYRSTENMGRALAGAPPCDWVLHLEDDIRPCADFLGSVARWIDAHVTETDRLVAFFSVSQGREIRQASGMGQAAVRFPVGKWASTVAAALRYADAVSCATWITANAATWRVGPAYPSWATYRGADKMLASWQQEAYPDLTTAVASVPCLVEHEGRQSSLARLGTFRFCQAPVFTGQAWGLR